MIFYTEVFGIKSDDLDAVTEDVAVALGTEPNLRYGEGRGGDYSAFDPAEGGDVVLQHNMVGLDEWDESEDWAEEDYKEFALIILVQQHEGYFDYEPKLTSMKRFPATLLYRRQYDEETRERQVDFELKTARSGDSTPAAPQD